MKIAEAVQYCENQGTHLPSARELAQFAVKLGAKGIVEACDSDDDFCQKVEAKNIDGKNDTFYFSAAGYRRPEGDLGKVWFSSSSVRLNGQAGFGFSLYGPYGFFGGTASDMGDAVLCVAGH
jgi:hypothetical protein